jgi:hypothetical protein
MMGESNSQGSLAVRHHASAIRGLLKWLLVSLILLASILIAIVFATTRLSSTANESARLVSDRTELGVLVGVSFRVGSSKDLVWAYQSDSEYYDRKNGGAYGIAASTSEAPAEITLTREQFCGLFEVGGETTLAGRQGTLYSLVADGSLATRIQPAYPTCCIHVGTDGAWYTGDLDGIVRELNQDTLEVTAEWHPHFRDVTSVRTDGNMVLSSSYDKSVYFHDDATSTGRSLKFKYIVEWIDVSPNSGHLLIGTAAETHLVPIDLQMFPSQLPPMPTSNAGCWLGTEDRYVLFTVDGEVLSGTATDPTPRRVKFPSQVNFRRDPVLMIDYLPSSQWFLLGHGSGKVQLIKGGVVWP